MEQRQIIVAPEPGLYENVAHETYLSWDAASNSALGHMRQSPAHCFAAVHGPSNPTPAKELGTALHFAILEPELFSQRYVIAPKVDKRTTKGKEEWAAFLKANPGKLHLDADGWEVCKALRDAVNSHPDAGPIIRASKRKELSGVWDDPATGVRCKLRMDLPCEKAGILADLKSTEDASPDVFVRSIEKYGYHRQGAHYLDGAAKLDLIFDQFVIIAFEKSPPYGVMVYQIEDEALEIGAKELAPLIRRYAECKRDNHWPGYPIGVHPISLPEWRLRREAAH